MNFSDNTKSNRLCALTVWRGTAAGAGAAAPGEFSSHIGGALGGGEDGSGIAEGSYGDGMAPRGCDMDEAGAGLEARGGLHSYN